MTLYHPPATLSIGIPAYNQGAYLRSTIESLLDQKVPPHEIVVSDNWSTDETYAVATTFGDKVKLIRPSRHLGMMAHWNFVVENLQGSWFSLLSSDDEAKPMFTDTMLKGIQVSDKAVLVRSGYEDMDGNGKTIGQHYILTAKKICRPPFNFYEQLLGPRVSFAAFAVRKAAWQQVGGFPVSLSLCGDWGFWLLLAPLGDFVYQHAIVSRYRTDYRPNISSQRLGAYLKDEVEIYTTIIPNALQRLDYQYPSKIYKASKTRCLKALAYVSQFGLCVNELEAALAILKPWAEATHNLEVWWQVQQGEKLPKTDIHNHFRAILRGFYQKLRSF